MEDLQHALSVAFHYPPEASSSGVLRTLKYSRFYPLDDRKPMKFFRTG